MRLNASLCLATATVMGLALTGPSRADETAEAISDDAAGLVSLEVAPDATEADAPPATLDGVGAAIRMDRSDWPVLVVTPADGTVTHNPHFVGAVALGEDEVSPLHAPDPVWQIQEALRGAEADNLNGDNLADLGAQPFVALARFVMIPFQAILENPWSEATSP